MNENEFEAQIKRLRTQWPNSYGSERMEGLWSAFKGVSSSVFGEAISDCIANQRSAPLLSELSKAVETAKVRESSFRFDRSHSPLDAMQGAADSNKTADPEFVKACMKLLKDKLDGRISHDNFLQGCNLLDEAARILNPLKKRESGRERSAVDLF